MIKEVDKHTNAMFTASFTVILAINLKLFLKGLFLNLKARQTFDWIKIIFTEVLGLIWTFRLYRQEVFIIEKCLSKK